MFRNRCTYFEDVQFLCEGESCRGAVLCYNTMLRREHGYVCVMCVLLSHKQKLFRTNLLHQPCGVAEREVSAYQMTSSRSSGSSAGLVTPLSIDRYTTQRSDLTPALQRKKTGAPARESWSHTTAFVVFIELFIDISVTIRCHNGCHGCSSINSHSAALQTTSCFHELEAVAHAFFSCKKKKKKIGLFPDFMLSFVKHIHHKNIRLTLTCSK